MRSSLSQQVQGALMFTSTASNKLVETQNHAVSGKRILRPSDDIPGTSRALSLRSSINSTEQFANNITVSKPLLAATQNAMQDLVKAVRSVRDIAVGAAEPDVSGNASQAYMQQLDDIMSQMVDLANTKHTDQFVFSGTWTDTMPVVANPDPVTAPTKPYIYQGNSGTRTTQVLSWVSLQVNVPGDTVFNFDGSAGTGTTDLFSMVQKVKDAIATGNPEMVSTELTNVDKNLDNLLANTARMGSWLSRLDNAQNTLEDTKNRLQSMLSDTEDVDLPEAVVQLKTQENVYQTALSITSRMLDLSLTSLQLK